MSLTEDISNGREQHLDEVLANYLHAAQEGRAPTRQALLDSHPELAGDLADFFADQDHVERLAAPLRTIAPPQPALAVGATLGDYELLDEIAHGGMGVVYRARQKSLQRIVALKVLQAGPLASPEQWQRFQAEAESIAGLDHPSIVPVYEIGVHENLPYFSMKLFEGGSLATAISNQRSAISQKEAASLLATVADAVQYAHQHGILHRDLKPANILLDSRRQPHVSDFGLAKRSGGSDVAPTPSSDTPPPAVELTISGAIVGTPSYMAPEQAAGSRILTTAADIYGLGAILYELLTGRPPFRGENLYETLRRLQEEEPTPPRTLNPRVDRDLETICLKCLRKEPQRRYASARELADDLRRFLNGEPILARPVGPLARVWLWCRRKPVAACGIAAFVALIVAAFLMVDWQRRRAVDNVIAKDEANRNLAVRGDKGRRLIDDFCRRLSEDGWGEDPVLQAKRKRMLEELLAYYRDFLDDPNAEAPVRDELIHTYYRIGDITTALGERDKARDAFNRGRLAAETLLQLRPDDRAARFGLARILNRLGLLDKLAGHPEDALKLFLQAHELLRAARDEAPDDTNLSGELGVACNNLGNLYAGLGRLDDARASYDECIDINRDLSRRFSDSQYTLGLAVGLENSARLLYRQGRRDKAWTYYDESAKLSRRLVDVEPSSPRYRQQLGRNLYNRGNTLCGEKRFKEAIPLLTEGRDVLERLVEMQPRIWWYQKDLVLVIHQLGRAHRGQARTEKEPKEERTQAVVAFQSAAKLYKELAVRDPNSDAANQAGWCLFDAGVLQVEMKQKNDALKSYLEARDQGRKLVKTAPDNLEHRKLLGMTLNNLGRQSWALKRNDDARAALREALEHTRLAFARSRQNSFYRRVLNTTYIFLGDVYRDTGRREEWAALLLERRRLWDDNARELYVIACDLARAGSDEEAMRTLEQAVRKGFSDLLLLEKDPSLEKLRSRPEFPKLMQELKARQPAASGGDRRTGPPSD
jgi:serine/threonine-protein kinase